MLQKELYILDILYVVLLCIFCNLKFSPRIAEAINKPEHISRRTGK